MKATFLKGVVLGTAVAVVTLVASAAVAGTGVGKVFNLGESNRVNARSQLEGATPSAVLNVTNSDKSASASGVSIDVPPDNAPLVVNSATKVKNFNADMVDGHDASSFQAATSKACANGTAIASITPNGSATCNGSVVLPIVVSVGPGASTGPNAFLPSSLGMRFDCVTTGTLQAEVDFEDLAAPTPATLSWVDEENNQPIKAGQLILAAAPNNHVSFGATNQDIVQIEYLDVTTVTTININLIDFGDHGCDFQGTVEIATR